jgi:hypothetical protein
MGARGEMVHVWLKQALKRSGKSQASLARYMRRGTDWVSLALNGKRKITYEDAVAMADFIGEQLPGCSLTPVVSGMVPVIGIAAEGVWRERRRR